jgi:hypothetical protein
MEAFYFLALLIGAALGFVAGAWFACKRVQAGADPVLSKVFGGGGGGPQPDR